MNRASMTGTPLIDAACSQSDTRFASASNSAPPKPTRRARAQPKRAGETVANAFSFDSHPSIRTAPSVLAKAMSASAAIATCANQSGS